MVPFANVLMSFVIVDLVDQRILSANAAAGVMFGLSPELLIGRLQTDFVVPPERDAMIENQIDLREGRLDGYQIHHSFLFSTGDAFEAEAWVRRLSGPAGSCTALIAISFDFNEQLPPSAATIMRSDAQATLMAITNHDWIIERASADSGVVLGLGPLEMIGAPFLGLIHPDDVANLLFAVARATATGRAVVCRMRLRTSNNEWRSTASFVNLLCEHSPPRLGIMSVVSEEPETSRMPRAAELEQRLQRIAVEIRAAEALIRVPEVPGRTKPEQMAALTSRQWEVLSRLSRGDTAARIAAALCLSPSTVRNQLSVMYRHFGVHSQVELLALFRPPVEAEPSGANIVAT
jgi:PAS domain S-box-containing protein